MSLNNIWYLPGPFHKYQEDVKSLAKEHGLRIVDANVTASRSGESDEVPEVTLREVARPLEQSPGDIGALREELTAINKLIDDFRVGEFSEPISGDTAINLFALLKEVQAAIQGRSEHLDGDKGPDAEIDELKATLDAAGVQYRANASKDTLEKLVADLPKE